MIAQQLIGSYLPSLVGCESADFDGTNDVMTRGAGLTGASDSATGSLVVWLRVDGGDGSIRRFFNGLATVGGAIDGLRFSFDASNQFLVTLQNTVGAAVYQMRSGAYTAGATWLCFMTSWDRSANDLSLLYQGDSDVKVETIDTGVPQTIDYTFADWAVGGGGNVGTLTELWNGAIAEFYFAPGQYLDFSSETVRRKFYSSAGKPVYLGANGSLPTGTAPLIYLHLGRDAAATAFATNGGSGGNFSITGTLDIGSTSPSD